jgi:hypothetical protein
MGVHVDAGGPLGAKGVPPPKQALTFGQRK